MLNLEKKESKKFFDLMSVQELTLKLSMGSVLGLPKRQAIGMTLSFKL